MFTNGKSHTGFRLVPKLAKVALVSSVLRLVNIDSLDFQTSLPLLVKWRKTTAITRFKLIGGSKFRGLGPNARNLRLAVAERVSYSFSYTSSVLYLQVCNWSWNLKRYFLTVLINNVILILFLPGYDFRNQSKALIPLVLKVVTSSALEPRNGRYFASFHTKWLLSVPASW